MPRLSLAATALLMTNACCPQGRTPIETTMPNASRIDSPTPPIAEKRATERTYHGRVIGDDYAWLRDASYPEVDDADVLAYLKAENSFYSAAMAPYAAVKETIFEELKGRVKQDETSVPFKDGNFTYQWRFDKGAQYRRWYRTPVGGADESVIIDEPALATDLDFFRLGGWSVSPNGNLLARTTDDDGSERFTLRVQDLESKEMLPDVIDNTIGSPVWAADNRTLFYLELNDKWRPFRVRAHVLGSDPDSDRIVYEEQDGSFFVGLHKTRSKRFIVIVAADHVTSEARILPADQPDADPQLVAARDTRHEYDVSHRGDLLYIRTNDTHKNFRIVTAPVHAPGRENWKPLLEGDARHYLRGLDAFEAFMVIRERIDGLDQIRILDYAGSEHHVRFPEATYAAGLGTNAEFETDRIRLRYESMVTPDTIFDYHVALRKLETRKVQVIPSGYDQDQYATERLMAPARDGIQIPISIVYPRGFNKDGTGPLHLYAYGAYGHGMPPGFSANRLSLLNRGFAYAIAHVRGGDEMGYQWYEDGKLLSRTNTFNDFVDAAQHLVNSGFVSAGSISISGGSAGGELMGAVANLAPHMWRAVVAHVPFVDVLNTMLDDTLPLTPIEWPEWGNPIEDPEAFDYIRSYSPYDNVTAQNYPPIMITAGINDPRVTYWEPAKWAAKLRATKTDDNLLVLKTNMGAGHGGKSGRFRKLEEAAEEYVFVLKAFDRAAPTK